MRHHCSLQVRYLELRSTPRAVAGRMEREEYCTALLGEAARANRTAGLGITVRVLLAVDRRQLPAGLGETARLLRKLRHQAGSQ